MLLHPALPDHHLSADSKDLVRLGMGFIATMAALVLGLLIASAKGFFDTQTNEVTELSAKTVLLDRALAHYGPETQEIRDLVRAAVMRTLGQLWSHGPQNRVQPDPKATRGEVVYDRIQELTPKNDVQRSIQSNALTIATDLGKIRWLLFEQENSLVSVPLLVILVFWLAVLFCSFGLFAPRNATVLATFVVCALSAAGAILLILEMYAPFAGLIQISKTPLRNALAYLGQ